MVELAHLALGADNIAAAGNEEVDGFHGLFEHAAGIVAQVENEAARSLLLQLHHGAAYLVARAFNKLRKTNVANAVSHDGGQRHAG